MTESEVVAKRSKVSFDSGLHKVNHFSLPPPSSHHLVIKDGDLKMIAVFCVLFFHHIQDQLFLSICMAEYHIQLTG